MSFSHGRTAQLFIDDVSGTERNVSAYLASGGLEQNADTPDVTAWGDTAKQYIAGIKDRSFKLEGHYDPTVEGYLNGVLNTATQFKYFPTGSASGRTYYDGTAICTDFSITSAVGDANKFSAGFQVTSNPTFGTA